MPAGRWPRAGFANTSRRCCFPWLALLFLPVAFFAKYIYSWMTMDPHGNSSLSAKWPVFTMPGFYITSAIFFGLWWLLSSRLRYWSLKQDETGGALCTHRMRFHSGWGMVMFALTLTFSGVLWMQAVQYQWFSAIYGVYFFASCVWAALAAVYVITVLLQRQRILDRVLHDHQFYFLGLLFFAFTVFQAYIEFAQYFVVWNANMPGRNFLVSHPRKRFVVVGGHDAHLRPFPAAVLRAAAGEGENRFQNHAAGLRVGFGDELSWTCRSTSCPRSIRAAIRSNGSGCNSVASRSWADFWVGLS